MKLRDYQSAAVNAVFEYWQKNQGEGNPVVVAPTGSGKSVIIAALIIEAIRQFPDARILVVSHILEIIKQDFEKLINLWPRAPAGFYNAALGKREGNCQIVFGTVQSMYKKAAILGCRHIVICDEAHMVQPGMAGMYGEMIRGLQEDNPVLKSIGLTATDFRTASGLLTEGEDTIFDDVVFDIKISDMLENGYWSPPISKISLAQADMKGVTTVAGDFSKKQMAERFSKEQFIEAALKSDLPFLEDRKSIALFCPNIEICNHVAITLSGYGVYCETMHGNNESEDNADRLERFRSGELRALSSVGMMTTGVDVPNIDCIILLFATKAPGLYVQTVGRGARPCYADGYDTETKEGRLAAIRNGKKPNFLILDHGHNAETHGAITHVEKPKKKEKGARAAKTSPLKVRICDICRSGWPLDVTVCGTCGHQLKIERDPTLALSVEASEADIMGDAFMRGDVAKWFEVDDVRYAKHQKEGHPNTLKATYYCGILQFSEWKHFERIGRLKQEALAWWSERSGKQPPDNVEEALKWVETLKKPARVQVKKEGKFYEVLRYDFQHTRKEPVNITARGSAYGGPEYAGAD